LIVGLETLVTLYHPDRLKIFKPDKVRAVEQEKNPDKKHNKNHRLVLPIKIKRRRFREAAQKP
jgi:hypothetical protein